MIAYDLISGNLVEKLTGIRHRLCLNGSRKNGFVVTVSTRALKVARRNSFSGLFHRYGTNPQRICTSSRLPSCATTVSTQSNRTKWQRATDVIPSLLDASRLVAATMFAS
jgi:hypothetical protein